MRTAALIALASGLCLTPAGQRFRTNIDAVRVDVLVTDGRRPVAGLRSDDFELRDRGLPQAIDSVTVADVPIDMMVALDTSGSVAGGTLEQLKNGVAAALGTLGPQDRAALVTFSSEIRLLQDWTDGTDRLDGALKGLTANGGTSLWDAVFTSLTLHDATPGVRRLVLVFSDGEDTSSWLPRGAVIDKARRSDAVIYAVALRSGTPPAGRQRAELSIRD